MSYWFCRKCGHWKFMHWRFTANPPLPAFWRCQWGSCTCGKKPDWKED